MTEPRFSIVIPTRERHETLHYTLMTCVSQEFENFELIVSDNFSSPETRKVVESFNDSKIRYVRTPKPLSMTFSFEFAVSHARGEYVIVIGDDDGLLPRSLAQLDTIIRETDAKAIRWELIFYNWPNMVVENIRNMANIPMGCDNIMFNASEVIARVIHFELGYGFLPMLYHSAIHRDLIRELKARTGRVFDSLSPDVYSGYAVGYIAENYLYWGKPMSVSAISGKSNGAAHVYVDGPENEITKSFSTLCENDNLEVHPQVPFLPKTVVTAVGDSFRRAKDSLFSDNPDLEYDRKYFILSILGSSPDSSIEQRNTNFDLVRTSLKDSPVMLDWFNEVIVKNYDELKDMIKFEFPAVFLSQNVHWLDMAKEFGVENVYELGLVYEKHFSPTRNLESVSA